MTTLYLMGEASEVQVRILSKASRHERRAFLRVLLAQIRPSLKYFTASALSDSGQGKISENVLNRSQVHVAQSGDLTTLSGAWGYEIRTKRTKLGLSQAELASILGMGRSHLSELERGLHHPHVKTRRKIEKLLQIKINTAKSTHPKMSEKS